MTSPVHFRFAMNEPLVPQFFRGRHALISVRDKDGSFYLGQKHVYPEGIVRLVGGGLDGDEDARIGAARELQEELGVSIDPELLKPLAEIILEIEVNGSKDQIITFKTFLFEYISDDPAAFTPTDDLDGVMKLTKDQMKELVSRFEHLSDDIQTVSGEPTPFRWSDYGKYYARVHEIALLQGSV
jgi:8-oxo-dGTP pyrophosphatase MutT (NUDIX family)